MNLSLIVIAFIGLLILPVLLGSYSNTNERKKNTLKKKTKFNPKSNKDIEDLLIH